MTIKDLLDRLKPEDRVIIMQAFNACTAERVPVTVDGDIWWIAVHTPDAPNISIIREGYWSAWMEPKKG